MRVEIASMDDIPVIMSIYQKARQFMRENGNHSQWGANHPKRELLEVDIQAQQLYTLKDNQGVIQGVFAFIKGVDPTYLYIEDGQWLNDEEYATLHRVASAGKMKGVFHHIIEYCKQQISHIRIDTHRDNHTMKMVIEREGFQYCGIIYIEDGSPRVAYQWELSE